MENHYVLHNTYSAVLSYLLWFKIDVFQMHCMCKKPVHCSTMGFLHSNDRGHHYTSLFGVTRTCPYTDSTGQGQKYTSRCGVTRTCPYKKNSDRGQPHTSIFGIARTYPDTQSNDRDQSRGQTYTSVFGVARSTKWWFILCKSSRGRSHDDL